MNGKSCSIEKLIEASISRPVRRPQLFTSKPDRVCTRPIPLGLGQKVAEPESKISNLAEPATPVVTQRFLGLKQVPEKRKRAGPLRPRVPKKAAKITVIVPEIQDELEEKSEHSDEEEESETEKEEKIQACQDKFVFSNNNASLDIFSEEPLATTKPILTQRLSELVAAQSINCHTDTTSRIREFVIKNRKMSDQPILLVTGAHGSGKTWCVNHVLKELNCHKVALDYMCDPSNITTNIRSALLWRVDKKQSVVVLDDVEGLSKKPFMSDFVDILTAMLMPLKDNKRKAVASARLVPNAVIIISASKFNKNVSKLTNVFGLANSKKNTKSIDKMMHAVCKPLGRTNIAGLVRETFGPCDLEKFTKVSVDCNYVFSQIEFDALMSEPGQAKAIDASSNVDMFSVGQSLLGNRALTSIDRVEQQWEKAGHLFPGMIHNSFPDFLSSAETYSEISELYSDKDLVFDNHVIDNTWNVETAFEFRENYACILQYGIQLALQSDSPAPTTHKNLQMFASKTKDTITHSRIPTSRFEIYSAMADISRTEQRKRLTEDLSYKPQEHYKLSEIDFCADMLNMQYLEISDENKKKSKKSVPKAADLIKRLSYAFKIAEE